MYWRRNYEVPGGSGFPRPAATEPAGRQSGEQSGELVIISVRRTSQYRSGRGARPTTCPECGNALVRAGYCQSCPSCGWGACG